MTLKELEFIVIIPARYGSSRFPGKPLALLGGREVILHVCDRVRDAGFIPLVATDDRRILDRVEEAGYKGVMTDPDHKSGTDRVYEAYCVSGSKADVVINVQGDEPFIAASQLKSLAGLFIKDSETSIATLARQFDKDDGFEALFDPSVVKTTFDRYNNALYFSRSIIPYVRGTEWKYWLDVCDFYTHVGVYAYRADVLRKITALPQSSIEKAESLEQMRWLQNGLKIKIALTEEKTIGIDTPSDLEAAEKYLG